MYIDLILLFRLHFMCWYFVMIEGTITLSQISLSSAPLGIRKWCMQSKYKLFFFSSRISFHPSLRNLNFGNRKYQQKLFTVSAKVVSSPVYFNSSRTFFLFILEFTFVLESSYSNASIFLSLSWIVFNNSLMKCFPTLSLLLFTIVAFGVESLLSLDKKSSLS